MKTKIILALVAVAMVTILLAGCDAIEIAAEKAKNDSIAKVKKEDSIAKVQEMEDWNAAMQKAKADSLAYQVFIKTPAGKIKKSHPEWSMEDCEKLYNKEIWLGMSIHMVVYLRGLPNHKNVSNYGSGYEYQYCWDYYDTSCFYTKEDQIVYSFN